jgi:hypothetical protein
LRIDFYGLIEILAVDYIGCAAWAEDFFADGYFDVATFAFARKIVLFRMCGIIWDIELSFALLRC